MEVVGSGIDSHMPLLSLPGACKLDGLQARLSLGMSETHLLAKPTSTVQHLHFAAIRSQVKASCRGASNDQCDMVGRASAGAQSLPETAFAHSDSLYFTTRSPSQLRRRSEPHSFSVMNASNFFGFSSAFTNVRHLIVVSALQVLSRLRLLVQVGFVGRPSALGHEKKPECSVRAV